MKKIVQNKYLTVFYFVSVFVVANILVYYVGFADGQEDVVNNIHRPEHVDPHIQIYAAEQAPEFNPKPNWYRVSFIYHGDSSEFTGNLEDLMLYGFDLHAVVEWSNL